MKTYVTNSSPIWEKILGKIGEYAGKIGRASTRPLLLLYYVLQSPNTPKQDKLLILSALSYLILPVDLISARRLPVIDWIDEIIALGTAYRKACRYVTPTMEAKADKVLDQWFPEYAKYGTLPE